MCKWHDSVSPCSSCGTTSWKREGAESRFELRWLSWNLSELCDGIVFQTRNACLVPTLASAACFAPTSFEVTTSTLRSYLGYLASGIAVSCVTESLVCWQCFIRLPGRQRAGLMASSKTLLQQVCLVTVGVQELVLSKTCCANECFVGCSSCGHIICCSNGQCSLQPEGLAVHSAADLVYSSIVRTAG